MRDRRNPNPSHGPGAGDWAIAVDVILRLGGSVVVGVLGGFFVDGWLRTSPIFTFIGLALGVGGAGYTVWDVARRYTRK
jgi:F0F1-type ATP synthase assembly protein I